MDAPIVIDGVRHTYGRGILQHEVLSDISATIEAGEIVLFTGPSGSGKTTLLTLIGALRSTQAGSVQVLGRELRGAGERRLVETRRHIGYIFQSHNLIGCLSARENVEMALQLHPDLTNRRKRSLGALAAVGLEEFANRRPRQLSGGQRQRVAVARALVTDPQIILADEPTASLDSETGRSVVELLRNLAKQHGVTVVVVTHDHRILDAADRVLHIEDGRLSSAVATVMSRTRNFLSSLAQTYRRGDMARQVAGLSPEDFVAMLRQFTEETREFRDVIQLAESDAFDSMIEQVLEAFTRKISATLNADRTTVFLVNRQRRELWSKFAADVDGQPLTIRLSMGEGIAGHVATTGEPLNIPDAHESPLFDPTTDHRTGYRTRSILCVPLRDREGLVVAVAQTLNRLDGRPFDDDDLERFEDLVAPIGSVLQNWAEMDAGGVPETAGR